MAKLTNQQKFLLEEVLRHLKRGHKYIHDNQLVICKQDKRGGTTLHYNRPHPPEAIDDGYAEYLYPMAKHSSDIVGLDMAIERLELFINGPKIEEA